MKPGTESQLKEGMIELNRSAGQVAVIAESWRGTP